MRRAVGQVTRVAVAAALALGTSIALAVTAGAIGPPPNVPPPFNQEPPDPALDLIGTWANPNIVDADGLCVTILVPAWVPEDNPGDVGQAIFEAVADWVDAVNATNPSNTLVWTDGTGGAWDGSDANCTVPGPVDVTIAVRRGGGQTQGTTRFAWNEDSYLVGAQINIQGKFQGTDNPAGQIGLIARHEFGHALGVGHWNISGQLMSPVLGGATMPNDCEVAAVLIAQAWFLGGAPGPEHYDPADDPYACDPTV